MLVAVRDFAAAGNGFAFANAFPSGPTLVVTLPGGASLPIGDAANGLCGGMAFAVRDFFDYGVHPLPGFALPDRGTPLFEYIVDRLIDSIDLPAGPVRYYEWMAAEDHDSAAGPGTLTRSRRDEWPRVQHELDNGRLVPLGLIRVQSQDPKMLGQNHQVLAFGYEENAGGVTLSLYDPNHPGQTVSLKMPNGADSLGYSTGEPLRGFFATPYRPRDPRFLVDSSKARGFSLSGLLDAFRRLFGR